MNYLEFPRHPSEVTKAMSTSRIFVVGARVILIGRSTRGVTVSINNELNGRKFVLKSLVHELNDRMRERVNNNNVIIIVDLINH